MKSATALTLEIDDLDAASEALVSVIREKLTIERSAIGIVYSDADVDVAELGDKLHTMLGFEIIGLTTTAIFNRNSGYCDMGISLTVITGSDVDISVGSAHDINIDNCTEKMREAYSAARERLPQDPRLILICSPYSSNLSSENYLEALDEASGNVPIFGGVATDHYDLQCLKTFHNGSSYSEAPVFVLISGNIHPVFSMQHQFNAKIERKSVITQSSSNLVERVGDKTFIEYLSDITTIPDGELSLYHFQSIPFVMELPDYEESEQPVVRVLTGIDRETGAGEFLSKMPQGSKLSINILQKDNLAASCGETIDDLLEKMKQVVDYEFCTVLVTTCNARHLLLGDTKDLEANILIEKLTDMNPTLNAAGFYAFGEMCPTAADTGGRAKNRYHNISFAICAF